MRLLREILGPTGLPGRSTGLAISVLASVFICVSPRPGWAAFGGGTGQPNDPFVISTAEHIRAIGADPNLWDKHFKLMEDINLADGRNEHFKMIGTADAPFSGVFDGNGHNVANLRVNTTAAEKCIGMFGHVMGKKALIENLRLVNPSIEAPAGENVGALVGRLTTGTITNCQVQSGRISGKTNVGGLVGLHGADSESSPFKFTSIVSCSSSADIFGKSIVGGLIGRMKPGTAVADCHTSGNVAGRDSSAYIGGLTGLNNFGSILHCSSGASVSAGSKSQNLGGLVGNYINGKIDNCYTTGNVSAGEGGKRIGGLVGHVDIGRITYCYSTGSVSAGQGSQYVGGLIGYFDAYGTLISSYTNGSLEAGEGTKNLGGLIGYSERAAGYGMYGSVVNCFWDVQASRMHKSAGGKGLTSAEMMDAETYSLNGWGSDPNWVLDDGKDYPHLAWEKKPGGVIPRLSTDRFEGEGTRESPYVVVTSQQLAFIGRASILWDKCFILVSDLDLTGVPVRRIGTSEGSGFTGSFNGNGHVIRNIGWQAKGVIDSAHGLFGYVSRAGRIRNLSLRNAKIRIGNNVRNVGILAHVNYGDIVNCHAHGSVVSGAQSSSLGGLVGKSRGTLDSCSAATVVAGGDNSYCIGGLVGENWGILTACQATSRVSAGNETKCLGGLTGSNDGNNKAKITNSYSDGSVTGDGKCWGLGGLVGRNTGNVVDSYAAAEVSAGPDSENVGGLVGFNSSLPGRETTNCYYESVPTAGVPDNGVGSPLNSRKMKHKSSFVGWDFTETWMIYEGQDRPHLKWEQDQGKV